ncbi:MAG: hypothetical protein Q9165_004283 [Trypethelium subeluteriae]
MPGSYSRLLAGAVVVRRNLRILVIAASPVEEEVSEAEGPLRHAEGQDGGEEANAQEEYLNTVVFASWATSIGSRSGYNLKYNIRKAVDTGRIVVYANLAGNYVAEQLFRRCDLSQSNLDDMLDSFEILTTSGVVLWSKTYVPVSSRIVNSLINDVFIEERISPTAGGEDAAAAKNLPYKKEKYTLKWTTAKDFGLIFVAVYQSLLQLSWIDKLLDNVRTLFTNLYGEQLNKTNTTKVECPFDNYFDRQVEELEKSSGGATAPAKPLNGNTTSTDASPITTPENSRPATPQNTHLLTAKGGPAGRGSRRARKAASTGRETSPASSNLSSTIKGSLKKPRKWDADGLADEDGDVNLDYSASASSSAEAQTGAAIEEVSQESWGRRTNRGEFVLRDIDDEMDSILSSAQAEKAANAQKSASASSTGLFGSATASLSTLFHNVVGGHTLSASDLQKPLQQMEAHLLRKNVAREAAVRLCDSVSRDLVGAQTRTFESVDARLRAAMESALRKMLTPTSSLDLLREIQAVRNPGAGGAASRPYVLSIVGVNGVGKSTNLSKIAFFLLQNRYRILIAAADTFRSGAVEQLRVHAANLRELSRREGGEIELYERGYGKDAAEVARDAVAYAARGAWDVVLVDTAGRRHNDARLMGGLEKFARLARPDKCLMVGEALVGGDAVQQARHFNESLIGNPSGGGARGGGRGLDGFIVSKCDTVGDMVGTLVSMVHATGIPVVFLGTGQHYSDLRTLNVGSVVRLLME